MGNIFPLLEPPDLVRWLARNPDYQAFYSSIRDDYRSPWATVEEREKRAQRFRKVKNPDKEIEKINKRMSKILKMTQEQWPILTLPFPPEMGKENPDLFLGCLSRLAEPWQNPLGRDDYPTIPQRIIEIVPSFPPSQRHEHLSSGYAVWTRFVGTGDLIGNRYLLVKLDLAAPWRSSKNRIGLDKQVERIVRGVQGGHRIQKRRKQRSLPPEFWKVVDKAQETGSRDPYKIGTSLYPDLFEKMTRQARQRKKAVRERIRKYLLQARELGIKI
jgi:hypothetical protein